MESKGTKTTTNGRRTRGSVDEVTKADERLLVVVVEVGVGVEEEANDDVAKSAKHAMTLEGVMLRLGRQSGKTTRKKMIKPLERR